MKRTQIYLPQSVLDNLKEQALKDRSTVSALIRDMIAHKNSFASEKKNLKRSPVYKNAGEWLLAQAKWAEKANIKGPADLATNMDEYLYGAKK